ncbi:MAG: AbrB/MazE/SpoVT family DNA-binding domain-containing protein [bacterium]
MTFATLSSKGQLTVPVDARRALGLHPGSRMLIETLADRIIIRTPGDLLSLGGVLGKAKSRSMERKAMVGAVSKRSRGAA